MTICIVLMAIFLAFFLVTLGVIAYFACINDRDEKLRDRLAAQAREDSCQITPSDEAIRDFMEKTGYGAYMTPELARRGAITILRGAETERRYISYCKDAGLEL